MIACCGEIIVAPQRGEPFSQAKAIGYKVGLTLCCDTSTSALYIILAACTAVETRATAKYLDVLSDADCACGGAGKEDGGCSGDAHLLLFQSRFVY